MILTVLIGIVALRCSLVESSSLKRRRVTLGEPPLLHSGVYFGGVNRNGRVIEAYTSEHTVEHGEEIMSNFMTRILEDARNDPFIPQPSIAAGYQITPWGNMTFGPHICRGKKAIIFPIQERPDWLIKYHCDCEELRSGLPTFHPLLKESFYGSKAAETSIAVKTLFVSPASFLCAEKEGICNFSMEGDLYKNCTKHGSTLRYAIMERSPGVTLYQYKKVSHNKVVSVKDAMTLAIGMMDLLETLHTTVGVTHGDIHIQNVLLEPSHKFPDSHRIKLIDFENATRNIVKPTSLKHERGAYSQFMCTQWQIDGTYPAARDDVMKAVQMIAELMNPDKYYSYGRVRQLQGYASLRSFKMKEFIFAFPEYDPIEAMPFSVTKKAIIRNELNRVPTLVRGMSDVYSLPPYRELAKAFQNSLHLL